MLTNQRFVTANSNGFCALKFRVDQAGPATPTIHYMYVYMCTRTCFTYLRTVCCVCVCCSASFSACAYNGGGGFHVMSSLTAGGAHSDTPSGLTAASCEPSAVSGQPVETQHCSRIFFFAAPAQRKASRRFSCAFTCPFYQRCSLRGLASCRLPMFFWNMSFKVFPYPLSIG